MVRLSLEATRRRTYAQASRSCATVIFAVVRRYDGTGNQRAGGIRPPYRSRSRGHETTESAPRACSYAEARRVIYVLKAEGLDRYKIGYSSDVERRLIGMQSLSPVDLECLGVLEGGVPDERILHDQFDAFRVKGEWFRGSPEMDALVATLSPMPRRTRHPTWPATRGSVDPIQVDHICKRCGEGFNRRKTPSRPAIFCGRACSESRFRPIPAA